MTDESTKFQLRRARPYNHFLTGLGLKLVFEPIVARFSYRKCLDQGKGWSESESVSHSSLSDFFDPMDASLLGSSVHEILQARILEWVAMPFSRQSSWPRDWTWVSCIAGGWILYCLSQQVRVRISLYARRRTLLQVKFGSGTAEFWPRL